MWSNRILYSRSLADKALSVSEKIAFNCRRHTKARAQSPPTNGPRSPTASGQFPREERPRIPGDTARSDPKRRAKAPASSSTPPREARPADGRPPPFCASGSAPSPPAQDGRGEPSQERNGERRHRSPPPAPRGRGRHFNPFTPL